MRPRTSRPDRPIEVPKSQNHRRPRNQRRSVGAPARAQEAEPGRSADEVLGHHKMVHSKKTQLELHVVLQIKELDQSNIEHKKKSSWSSTS
ncbi:unnamed protein product [Bursaphelenchus okinawaensis]|uniref:Uncharacterized protein n=1 Tax=Bursaphelenchus okinawaensis TaxID=465554 RepID=A0A811JWR6_9BILA|nr:unnamed protein product [Bursaphelenchus okinawaensis]CAG9086105.1 unnamed protein product [Bursaphelenchus okinawaensis]